MSSNVRLRQSRVSEAESFVDQVNRVGEETVGDAPCGGMRSCSRRRVGTGGDGVFHWMLRDGANQNYVPPIVCPDGYFTPFSEG
jgi:hypothetical protein